MGTWSDLTFNPMAAFASSKPREPAGTIELALTFTSGKELRANTDLAHELAVFRDFGQATRKLTTSFSGIANDTGQVPTFVNEFWTARQRQAHSLHEISYRACFKPQLPRFFIERLTRPSALVYDPFLGRGTTLIEAALLGRRVAGCDINPLSSILTAPRLRPPTLPEVRQQLARV